MRTLSYPEFDGSYIVLKIERVRAASESSSNWGGFEMGWLVLRWQNMTSVHFYCLLTFIFMLKSCGVVGGSIWIIKSALVLFWPHILNLTRTLDQDQDPSLTIVLIKMVLKWEILCNPWIHYLYCSFIFTNLFFCNSFQLCFWENCHLPSFSGTYTLLHSWHQITQTMNDDDCDSWAGVSHILGQTL